MTPTPQQIVETLAEAVGARRPYTHEARQSCYVVEANDRQTYFEIDSLDSMAIVEAELEKRGLYESYYELRNALATEAIFKGRESIPWKEAPSLLRMAHIIDQQSASVRALAAYQLLKGKE